METSDFLSLFQMSDFPVESAENGDMAAVIENFQKKNAAMPSRPQVTGASAAQVSALVPVGGPFWPPESRDVAQSRA